MPKGYILGLDQSTSGTKAILVNQGGDIVSKVSTEHRQYYPNPGWVEHDPVEIYENVKKLLAEIIEKSGLDAADIDVLSITNQRETVLIWDKNTGDPVYNAIVWQCRRTSELCEELKNRGFENIIKDKTGLLLDPYFSATKIKWIMDNVPGVKERAREGELLLGTIDSWLIWKLTGGKVHATDYTNASRTLIFNIKDLKWDKELLEVFEIPEQMLPAIKSSDEIFGYTADDFFGPIRIPISGVIGDSQGALFGQCCFETGRVKATYGTGSSIMMNIGEEFRESDKGLVTSIAWGISGRVEYVLEGIVHCTGDALKWVKDGLGLFENFEDARKAVVSLDSNEGVYMVPAFVGLGIPHWNPEARATISGMSRGTNKAHIIRASVESAAYQIKDAIDTMINVSGITPKELRVDGGPTKDQFLMQFQADLLGVQVISSEISELSSMGSVYLAGMSVGIWKDKEAVAELRKEAGVYTPMMEESKRVANIDGWKAAVRKTLCV